MLEYGDTFGPWVAGPEGCILYGFIACEGSAFIGDSEAWQKLLDETGAEMLPVPRPKRIPPWKTLDANSGVVDWSGNEV